MVGTTVAQAGLKFVTHHALLFRQCILAEASELFTRLLTCLHTKHKRVAQYAPDACAAVLVQVKVFAVAFYAHCTCRSV